MPHSSIKRFSVRTDRIPDKKSPHLCLYGLNSSSLLENSSLSSTASLFRLPLLSKRTQTQAILTNAGVLTRLTSSSDCAGGFG